MKKLLILSAMAMSAGAIFADPLASEGFEGKTAGTEYSGSNIATLGDNWGTTGVSAESTETEATVTAYETAGEHGDKYLALSTTTGSSLDFYHDTLKTTASVATDAIYFDSYVQFTPTPLNSWADVGDATQAGMVAGDKIAVWLANIEATDDKAAATKLMITAGVNTTGDTIDLTNFMADATVTAETWYRLTIAATGGTYGENLTTVNFKVYVDGTEVSAFAVAGDDTVGETAQTSFQSAVANDDDISNVGFKGTGAVDTLVWTREDPFAIEGAEFEIGTKQYPTFAAALAEAESGATITMIADSETAIEVTDGKNVTLDLNGCTLSAGISNAGTLTIVNNNADGDVAAVTGNVSNSGNLTIEEVDVKFTGTVVATTVNGGFYTTRPTGTIPADKAWYGPDALFEDEGDSNEYYYLDIASGEDPVINPAAEKFSVEVAAADGPAAITKVKEAIAVPSGATVEKTTYADYFNYKATASAKEGYFTVEIESIKEDKIAQVENNALEALQGDGSTITVLPGLYYGFAAGAAPTGLTVSALDLATGTTMNIVKPESTDKGFLKVVVSPKPTLDSAE